MSVEDDLIEIDFTGGGQDLGVQIQQQVPILGSEITEKQVPDLLVLDVSR